MSMMTSPVPSLWNRGLRRLGKGLFLISIDISSYKLLKTLFHSCTLPCIYTPSLCISVIPSIQCELPSVIRPLVGSNVTIDCRASTGDVMWYHNAVSVLSLSRPTLSVVTNGSLLLQNVSRVDDGFYQAFVRTSVHEINSQLVTLQVKGRYEGLSSHTYSYTHWSCPHLVCRKGNRKWCVVQSLAIYK